ncbi:MAG: hypothetical protein Q9216_005721, partial [Gyalolechia sp. 2 TL-2023]
MAEPGVVGPSTLDVSAAPAALEGSSPLAKDERVVKRTMKHIKGRAKDTFEVVLRGDIVWRLLEKGKGSKTPSGNELTPFTASKDAIQRSRLARESTELREKEEADRAKRLAEREASRESQRRARGESSASNLSTTFRNMSFRPRRPSNLARVESSNPRPATAAVAEPAVPDIRPYTFEQAIRHGQQHGRGVESVAEEMLTTHNNSVANLPGGAYRDGAAAAAAAAPSPPQNVVKKAHSSHHLMPVETPPATTTAESSASAVSELLANNNNNNNNNHKAEGVRATKSAMDLRDGGVAGEQDSAMGSSVGTNSLDSVRRVGVLAVRKK